MTLLDHRALGALAILPALFSCAALQDVSDHSDAPLGERRSTSQISFLLGARDYSDDTIWGEVDSSVAVGAEYSESSPSGLGWEAGAIGSISSSGGDVSGAAAELFGGVRKTFYHGRWRPYASAGIGTIGHLSLELLRMQAGIQVTHVP